MTQYVNKRAFLAALDCLAKGWYVHNDQESPPGPGLQWRFYSAAEVARRARAWLGDGRSLPRTPVASALEETTNALASGTPELLFEASLSWDGLVARADALRKSDGGWTILEIKASKSPKNGVPKDKHLDDIAYTTCVAMGAGLPIVGASLVLISREYILDGHAEMFSELDVTAEALDGAADFARRAQELAAACQAEARPEASLKFVCRDCEFFETKCIGKGVEDPLFDLPRLSKKRFEDLQPFERVSQLPADAPLTEKQQQVAAVIRSGRERVDEVQLRALDDVVWPAYYLDFEAVMPFIPWFPGSPSFDVVPFQYSIHVLASPGDEPEHREYIAPLAGDWRRELTERLLLDLGEAGSVIVYSSYEKVRLNALGKLFPDLRDRLGLVVDRIFDLEKVIKGGYVHPGFRGKTSIKNVLPVMVPDLTYGDLQISQGDDAAGVFGLMHVGKYPSSTHDQHRSELLEYCRLDTLAMVQLHDALRRVRDTQHA